MKKLGLFRLFTCLPLIAIVIPNITESLMNPNYRVPLIYLIAGTALIVVIGICTAIIYYLNRRVLSYDTDKIKISETQNGVTALSDTPFLV